MEAWHVLLLVDPGLGRLKNSLQCHQQLVKGYYFGGLSLATFITPARM